MPRHWLRAAGLLAALSFSQLLAQQTSAPASGPVASSAPAVVGLWAVGPSGGDKNLDCAATGFLVNEDGYILTNAHVVERARQCLSASPGAKLLSSFASRGAFATQAVACDVIEIDDAHDLAILKTERPVSQTLGLAPERSAIFDPVESPVGTLLYVTAFPAFAKEPITQSGRLVRYSTLQLFPNAPPSRTIVMDVYLRRGSSGSPVYTKSGAVVGIVESRDEAGETVAVPAQFAVELLKHRGIAVRTAGN